MKTSQDAIRKRIQRRKMITVPEVADVLECAIRTARRRLSEWKTWRSCNGNGKFYTLPEIPVFDEHGLWRNDGIIFSKHGNLKKTLLFLVRNSPGGLSGHDLQHLLGIPANAGIVYEMRDAGRLRLERIAGRIALFDGDEETSQRQRGERESAESVPMPKCEDTLMVFVEMIKCSGIEPREISVRLRKAGRDVSEASICRLLAHYDLLKKSPPTQ